MHREVTAFLILYSSLSFLKTLLLYLQRATRVEFIVHRGLKHRAIEHQRYDYWANKAHIPRPDFPKDAVLSKLIALL